MREIKFRAWDKKNNKMYTGITLYSHILEDQGVGFEANEDDWWNYPEAKYIVWMQYTGFKDKNNKEIYEGDILRNTTIKPQLVQVVWSSDIIGVFGGGFKVEKLQNEPDWMWRYDIEKLEVIGNIYENPELIK